jgi:hypothetical protein
MDNTWMHKANDELILGRANGCSVVMNAAELPFGAWEHSRPQVTGCTRECLLLTNDTCSL